MRDWPPIHDPQLLEWLALDDDEAWPAALLQRAGAFGRRPWDQAAFEHALRYPWERPSGSFVLRDGEVEEVANVAPRPPRRRACRPASPRSTTPRIARRSS